MLTPLRRLPNVPRPRMSICILADAADIDRAKQIDLEYMSVDDLKKCIGRFFVSAGNTQGMVLAG